MAVQDKRRNGAIQDTGNAVLDTTVNLLMNWPASISLTTDQIPKVHEVILKLYEQEPKRVNQAERKPLGTHQ